MSRDLRCDGGVDILKPPAVKSGRARLCGPVDGRWTQAKGLRGCGVPHQENENSRIRVRTTFARYLSRPLPHPGKKQKFAYGPVHGTISTVGWDSPRQSGKTRPRRYPGNQISLASGLSFDVNSFQLSCNISGVINLRSNLLPLSCTARQSSSRPGKKKSGKERNTQ